MADSGEDRRRKWASLHGRLDVSPSVLAEVMAPYFYRNFNRLDPGTRTSKIRHLASYISRYSQDGNTLAPSSNLMAALERAVLDPALHQKRMQDNAVRLLQADSTPAQTSQLSQVLHDLQSDVFKEAKDWLRSALSGDAGDEALPRQANSYLKVIEKVRELIGQSPEGTANAGAFRQSIVWYWRPDNPLLADHRGLTEWISLLRRVMGTHTISHVQAFPLSSQEDVRPIIAIFCAAIRIAIAEAIAIESASESGSAITKTGRNSYTEIETYSYRLIEQRFGDGTVRATADLDPFSTEKVSTPHGALFIIPTRADRGSVSPQLIQANADLQLYFSMLAQSGKVVLRSFGQHPSEQLEVARSLLDSISDTYIVRRRLFSYATKDRVSYSMGTAWWEKTLEEFSRFTASEQQAEDLVRQMSTICMARIDRISQRLNNEGDTFSVRQIASLSDIERWAKDGTTSEDYARLPELEGPAARIGRIDHVLKMLEKHGDRFEIALVDRFDNAFPIWMLQGSGHLFLSKTLRGGRLADIEISINSEAVGAIFRGMFEEEWTAIPSECKKRSYVQNKLMRLRKLV